MGYKMGYDLKKCLSGTLRGIFSGDGRTRTAVQTTYKTAFYTLILPLIVGIGLPEDGPSETYPLRLNADSEALPHASGLIDTPISTHNRHKVRRDTRRARSLGGPD